MTRVEARHSSSRQNKTPGRFRRSGTAVFAVAFVGVVLLAGWANAKRIGVPAASAQQGRDEIRIELNSNGFSPNEVQHAPGSFAIAVENSTLSSDYKLRLKAEDGTVLNEVEVQKGSSAWTVNLQTGRYTLTEVNHSQWICNVIVQ
jgi:hypothetical protein